MHIHNTYRVHTCVKCAVTGNADAACHSQLQYTHLFLFTDRKESKRLHCLCPHKVRDVRHSAGHGWVLLIERQHLLSAITMVS